VSPLDTLLTLIALGGLLSTLTLTVLAVHWCVTASRDDAPRDLHADAAGGFTAGPRQRLGVSRQLVDERRVRQVLAPRSGDVSNVVPLDERHGGAA
jgi:hypothetical protein